jgi:predicted kinase
VLYDLAFLLMDLTERGLAQAANTVLDRYLAETRRMSDLDALAALPLVMSMRAAIRAKVTAARIEAVPDRRDALSKAARNYFGFACSLIDPPPPRLVAVGGLSGTGKSVLGRALAPHVPPAPGAVHLRSDVERKVLFGVAETTRLPAEAYGGEAGTRVYAALNDKARRILGAGHSVVVDAVFARAAERTALAAVAAAAGVRFDGLFLAADLATRLERVGNRRDDASDAEASVVAQQQHYQLGDIDWTEVDASGTPDDTLARARAAIEQVG